MAQGFQHFWRVKRKEKKSRRTRTTCFGIVRMRKMIVFYVVDVVADIDF